MVDLPRVDEDAWPEPAPHTAVRLFFATALVLSILAVYQLLVQGVGSGNDVGRYSWQFVILLAITFGLGLLFLFILVVLYSRSRDRLAVWFAGVFHGMQKARAWNLVAVLLVWLVFIAAAYWAFDALSSYIVRIFLLVLAAGTGGLFFSAARRASFFWSFLVVFLLYGSGIKLISFLPDLSTTPFSLSWSEASRYYYASLPYARQLFGMDIPLSPWHPSRYLLQGIPFWIPDSSILVHRLWQVILWLGFSAATGFLLARKTGIKGRGASLVFTAWASLFLLQGPVYYHLLICVILVLVGFDVRRFGKTLLFVILASFWAGLSRINWYPVPALLAVMLFLLETPFCQPAGSTVRQRLAGWWQYLWRPAVFVAAGGVSAVVANAAYMALSGHSDLSLFSSTFNSDLLWYRLLPSPTYPPGVLPAILIVSAPLLAVVTGTWMVHWKDWHGLRRWGIAGILLVFFAGGLVVSTKIGGGSNIHNVDAFLAILLVLATYLVRRYARSERGGQAKRWLPWSLVAIVAIVPVVWQLNLYKPFSRPDLNQAAADLNRLQKIVREYAGKGEVLFMTQRQLLLFRDITDVPLVADYELLTVSEMSISYNQAYLERFAQDLASHRFALIIAEPQREKLQDHTNYAFAEENNAWVVNVARPILTYYETLGVMRAQNIVMFVPKD